VGVAEPADIVELRLGVVSADLPWGDLDVAMKKHHGETREEKQDGGLAELS
jgi:hypothetical protein